MTKAKTDPGEAMRAAACDRIMEKRLRKKVLPICDAIASGQGNAVPADEAWAMIVAHMRRAEPRSG
ncbi:hypothetical protein [Bosea sp. CS1GBMeth4]|uniref:hypothetical protein n=1 Tax=Bosea sp. CS1GBMeth4 TaxID=1892849 RepID=UPI001644E006|nr:hypothetical protein [Bosea sp. CS1GBMeth4]